MEHKLKILPQYFKAVQSGEKTFELRKNDRGFKVGDTLVLREYDWVTQNFTGNQIEKEISYILESNVGFGLEEGYCVLGLKDKELKEINWNLITLALAEKIAGLQINIDMCKENKDIKHNLSDLEFLLNQYQKEYRKILILQQKSNK